MLHEAERAVRREMREIVAVPGDEVVEPDDLVAVGKKAIGEMRTEKAGGAGDQRASRGGPARATDKAKPSACICAGS